MAIEQEAHRDSDISAALKTPTGLAPGRGDGVGALAMVGRAAQCAKDPAAYDQDKPLSRPSQKARSLSNAQTVTPIGEQAIAARVEGLL